MSSQRVDKIYRTSRNRIVGTLLVIMLLLYLMYVLGQQMKITDILIKRNYQQGGQIEQLERDVSRLEKVVVYQHQQIQEISEQPTKIEYIKQETVKQETPQETTYSDLLKPDFTTTIIGALATLGGSIKLLIPQF